MLLGNQGTCRSRKKIQTYRFYVIKPIDGPLNDTKRAYGNNIISYIIYLFRQSKVYSYNNKGFTVDIWNFKIQNNSFSFVYMEGLHINKEFVVGKSFQKAVRLSHQAPLF